MGGPNSRQTANRRRPHFLNFTANGPSMARLRNAARAILARLVFSNEKACRHTTTFKHTYTRLCIHLHSTHIHIINAQNYNYNINKHAHLAMIWPAGGPLGQTSSYPNGPPFWYPLGQGDVCLCGPQIWFPIGQ